MYRVLLITLGAIGFAPLAAFGQAVSDDASAKPAPKTPAPIELSQPRLMTGQPINVDNSMPGHGTVVFDLPHPGAVPMWPVPVKIESVADLLGQDEESSPFNLGSWPWFSKNTDCKPGVERSPCIWFGFDTLFMWEKRQPLPSSLVTSGSASDPIPGAIGQPHTFAVSPDDLGHDLFVGGRISAGAWLDEHSNLGVEADGFLLQTRGSSFGVNSGNAGSPLLALSYIDQPAGIPNAFLLSGPTSSGSVVLNTDSQLGGAELNGMVTLIRGRNVRVTGLIGSRYLGLQEHFALSTDQAGTIVTGGSTLFQPYGSTFTGTLSTQDSFKTQNNFVGGQLGLRGEYCFAPFFVSATTLIAIGGTEESADVAGYTTLLPVGGLPLVAPGGVYALSSNSGHLSKTKVSYLPEILVKGGLDLTSWCRATVGYDFLYLSRVLRPGDQLDLNIDPRQVPISGVYQPGILASSPHSPLTQSSFWVQGVTLGLELRF